MTSRQEIFDRAVAQHRAGRADLAEPIYRQTVAEDKGHHQAWHLLGVIALQREQFAEAIAFLEIATGLDHTNPKYLNNLGNALGQSGNLAAAEIAFRRANDLDKQFADPLYNLGVIYHRHHNLTRAEALYREVLEQNPEHPGANNNLGSLYNDRGQCEEALPYFKKAVSSDPDFMAASAPASAATVANVIPEPVPVPTSWIALPIVIDLK